MEKVQSILYVLITSITVSGFFSPLAIASPWPREKGDGLIISRIDYFRSAFPDNNMPPLDNVFERFETNSYLEYGLSDRILFSGKFVYGTSTQTANNETIRNSRGITEVEAGLQYSFHRSDQAVTSVRVATILLPAIGSGTRSGVGASGQDVELSFLHGRSVRALPFNAFVSGIVSYRARFGPAADQIRAQTTLGLQPNQKFLILAELFSETSLGNNEPDGPDFDVVKFQPSVAWHFSQKSSLNFGVSQEIASRNLNPGRTIFIGLWRRF